MIKINSKQELQQIILERLTANPNASLNDLDVSNVTDMSRLFMELPNHHIINPKISKWNVRNVTNMRSMFEACTKFNQDLSKWNTGKVTDMSFMFMCYTNFNKDISGWNVTSVRQLHHAFDYCYIPKDHKPVFTCRYVD